MLSNSHCQCPLVILIVLLQLTYRRKKPKKQTTQSGDGATTAASRLTRRRGQSRQNQGYGFYQRRVDETSPLVERISQTWMCSVYMCVWARVWVVLVLLCNNIWYNYDGYSPNSACIVVYSQHTAACADCILVNVISRPYKIDQDHASHHYRQQCMQTTASRATKRCQLPRSTPMHRLPKHRTCLSECTVIPSVPLHRFVS